ncbi:zinc-ribbon domain-containing protein [Corallococcus sp. M34]|uniref:AgmX/PglI C-terminal domain-containing protein n=1 Tax=Citreicoccus inhibens TaxID=2849499 RepID=UPI001C22D5C1|nr:AgmX/PglI C-terminal domain-containing protein [Citreicoccus inhibens]MBU8900673.1 zinc-ribbon domain-containing protein [Citreicoccus inhibens]
MNFTCDNCQKRYSIADEKVRGKTVKVRCKNCQSVITVQGPAEEESTRVVSLADVERIRAQERSLSETASAPAPAPAPVPAAAPVARAPVSAPQTPWDDEPTRAAPVRQAAGAPWFVMVRNKQEGPLDEAALADWVSSGSISARSFFWRQGMPDWKRGSDIPELAAFFAPPPEPVAPPPPVAAPPPPPAPARAAPRREPEPQAFMPEPESEEPPPNEEDEPERTFFSEPAAKAAHVSSGRRGQAARAEAPAASAAPLNELFSDLDLPGNRGEGEGEDEGAPDSDEQGAPLGGDPNDESAPVEDTRYFMKKSGVTRRNPAWKIALFVVLIIVVPVGILYALSATKVVPLTVKRVDAEGRMVEQPVFSVEGVGALRDKLLGRTAAPPPSRPVESDKRPATPKAAESGAQQGSAAPANGKPQGELAAVYSDTQKAEVGPEVRKDAEVAAKDSASAGGPAPEEVQRVVAQTQPGFRNCIEQELRKNPKFRGGKVTLTATVGASGTVKAASFDRADINGSGVGECLKDRAKRMVFSSFSGDDVDLQVPLVLSGTM